MRQKKNKSLIVQIEEQNVNKNILIFSAYIFSPTIRGNLEAFLLEYILFKELRNIITSTPIIKFVTINSQRRTVSFCAVTLIMVSHHFKLLEL